MKKLTALISTCLILLLISPIAFHITAHAYSSDVHEYLTEEGLKFLKTKNPDAYDEMSLYLNQLRQGSYDEDAIGPLLNEKIDTYWRPLRHFYRITDGLGYFDGGDTSISSLLSNPNISTDFSNSVTTDATDNRRYPNAYEWASGNEILNKHDFQDAIDAYKAGNKADAYYKLGFVLHLIEDMSVPEHTQLESHNNDPFPTGGLEEGSGYEQFIADQYSGVNENDCSKNKLRNYLHAFCTQPGVEDPFQAIAVEPVFSYYDDVLSDYTNLKQYFDSMATLGYYRNRFQADLNAPTGTATRELADMFEISHVSDDTWMIFSDVGLWGGGDTVRTTDTWWETSKFDGNPDESGWYYIENSYNKLDLHGKTKPKVYKKDWYSYAENEMKKTPSQRFKTPYSGEYIQNTEDKVLADVMAEDLIPLSVQHAAGVMDLFWRETRPVEFGGLTLEVNGTTLQLPSYTDFGDVSVGSSKTYTFTIRNNGEGVLFIAAPPELTSGDIGQFEVLNGSSNQYLNKGESTTFQIKFSPTTTGDKIAGLYLESSDGLELFNVEGSAGKSISDTIGNSAIVSCDSLSEPYIYHIKSFTSLDNSPYFIDATPIGESRTGNIGISNPDDIPRTIKISGDTDQFELLNFSEGDMVMPNECASLAVKFAPTSIGRKYLDIDFEGIRYYTNYIVGTSGVLKYRTIIGGDSLDSSGDYYLFEVSEGMSISLFSLAGWMPIELAILKADNASLANSSDFPPGTIIKIRKDAFDLAGSESVFSDTTNHWAENYISQLYEKGIVKGRTDTTFEPNATINRAEMIKLAVEAKQISLDQNLQSTSFADVSPDAWYAPYVQAAYNEGIIEGYTEGNMRYFSPESEVIRVDALKILLYSNGYTETEATTDPSFSDVKSSQWFYNLVAYAKNSGIVGGYTDGTFRPAQTVTRAEASKMLYELFF